MIQKASLVGVIALLLVLLGCDNPASSDSDDNQGSPIRLGVVGAHSGNLAEFGIPTLRAANLIADAANADGGILDRQIEIVAVDDECDPSQGAAAAEQAIDSNIVAVVGHTCSGATGAALSVYAQSEIPVISPSATRPPLTTDGSPFFFRTIVPDFEDTKTMIDTLLGEDATRIHILYESTGSNWEANTIDTIESQISGEATHTGSTGIDFTSTTALDSTLPTIEDSSTDGIILLPATDGEQGTEVAGVINALRDGSFSGPVATTADAYEQTLITTLSDSTGVYVVQAADPLETSAGVDFNQEHLNTYDQDGGPFFVQGGAALEVLLGAIEKSRTTEADSLVSAIETGTFTTVIGEIEFVSGNPSGGQTGYITYEISGDGFSEYSP